MTAITSHVNVLEVGRITLGTQLTVGLTPLRHSIFHQFYTDFHLEHLDFTVQMFNNERNKEFDRTNQFLWQREETLLLFQNERKFLNR